MKKRLLMAIAILAVPMVASADGLRGDCADCHTMHNSEQGKPVAVVSALGTAAGSISETPVQNLLRLDCIACHAKDGGTGNAKIWLKGDAIIPQVAHTDSTDLAGGNFNNLAAGQRKGHNVREFNTAVLDNGDGSGLNNPPGMYHRNSQKNFGKTATFDQFTCAGAKGCHGTRAQALTGSTVDNGTANVFTKTLRTGIAALTGAHHTSFDGKKDDAGYTTTGAHDGKVVSKGYRFIPGLKGWGNTAERWQNNTAASHNEYFGSTANIESTCGSCHVEDLHEADGNFNGRNGLQSNLKVPNGSMSGFCATCHGIFHTNGTNDDISTVSAGFADGTGGNGVSGAFLRHPSDYVLSSGANTTEYDNYTNWTNTAPVARPTLQASAALVNPATDMVMCLSCHSAHATANDYMLRFDYSKMTAGVAAAADLGTGCLACHTTKGVEPANGN